MMPEGDATTLDGVPKTMLWTLHNRASEAGRPDGVFRDDEARRIYASIEVDYERFFGPAEPSHALRSAVFDAAVRRYVRLHPRAVVVNLGEGLETQRYRLADLDVTWFSVDVPEAIALRERFILPGPRHRHLARSVLDRAWFDAIPRDRPVVFTAQGLFMYFPAEELAPLFRDLAARFPGAELLFDTIPRWLSRKTLSPAGWRKTPHYVTPPMPWGINGDELGPTMRTWMPGVAEVEHIPWPRFPRGFVSRWLFPVVAALPVLRRHVPAIVRVTLPHG